MVVVSSPGKYHGHVQNEEAARKLPSVKEGGRRLLTDEEWAKVCSNPDKRAELCATLGTEL